MSSLQFDKVLSGSLSIAMRSLVRAVEQFGGAPSHARHMQVTCKSHAGHMLICCRLPPATPAPTSCDWRPPPQQGVLPLGFAAHTVLCVPTSGTSRVSRLGGKGRGGLASCSLLPSEQQAGYMRLGEESGTCGVSRLGGKGRGGLASCSFVSMSQNSRLAT